LGKRREGSLDQYQKNISEQGSSAMPNVSEKEEQSKGSMTKSEPTPWTDCCKKHHLISKSLDLIQKFRLIEHTAHIFFTVAESE
jgi:hypothetical protein